MGPSRHQIGLGRALASTLVGFALVALGAPATGVADDAAWMYDPDTVVEIHLGDLSEAELDALEADPGDYQKGTFELTVGGVPKGPLLVDVGIRLKGGAGSGRPVKTGKSGLKLRFDEFVDDQLFFGIKRLTLNNMIQDPSMVHETLTYETFHALGLPASRTGYAFLNLNGEKYGLFLNIETLDEISLPRWFGDNTEHLYEADAPKTDVTIGGASNFEVDEGDDEDLADLEALIAAVNSEDGDWSDGVDATADLRQMTAQWAIERYVAHWDGYAGIAGEFRPNNYYLHSDTTGVFQMMPWGTDQTWERDDVEFDEPSGGLMFNKCLDDVSCKDLYIEGLTKVHCVVPGLGQGARVGQLTAMLQPYQGEEDVVKREATAEEIAEEVENVEDFAALRPEQLADFLSAEGVLGAGSDPCAPPPAPEPPKSPDPTAAVPMPPLAASDPPSELAFGPSKAVRYLVATRVTAPGAGRASMRVTANLGGVRKLVCAKQKTIAGARTLALRCRLSEAAREQLETAPLKLRIRLAFHPRGGTPTFRSRTKSLPRTT